MKYFALILFVLVFLETGAKKKEPFFPHKLIPDELFANANSVVREKKTELEILSPENIVFKERRVVTVLNKNGDYHAALIMPYDTEVKPEVATANIYDADGELIRKVKSADIKDNSYFDGFSLYNDSRYKSIVPYVNKYPYTVEYEFVYNYKGAIGYPGWRPTSNFKQSVENATFLIQAPVKTDIRIKESFIKAKLNGKIQDDLKLYEWEVEKLKALEDEPYAVPFHELCPAVAVSPTAFSYYGHSGNMETWKDFGDWVNNLLVGRDELPVERKEFVHDLLEGEKDTLKRIELLYSYVQQNIRYVSIQMGIGGLQPFEAKVVDETGYGDCKAISNYMKALLKEAGIDSYYTLVNAGKRAKAVDPRTPKQAFNHVILTVPVKNDTIFLECTSQTKPCGFLGSFTANRYALLIDKNNSRLIRTNNYDEGVNKWESKVSINLLENGDALIHDTVRFSGLQYEYVEDELDKTKDKQIEAAYKWNNINGAEFKDLNYTYSKEIIPYAVRKREITVKNLASKMGVRLFVPLNSINKRTVTPKRKTDRIYPFRLYSNYHDSDTILFRIPKGFISEHLPADKVIESEFGRFASHLEVQGNNILFIRDESVERGTYPPEKYADYVAFRKKIVKADSQKIILKKADL